jgi:serpin B
MKVCTKPLVLLLIACPVLFVAGWVAETAPSPTADQAAVVEGNNTFAIELYRRLGYETGNLFFSPESISTALAMTYAGARADTAAEMARTLHFTLPPGQLHPAMGALLRDRNAAHDGYQLKEADALWVQKGYSLLPEFLQLNKDNYEAGLNQLDFKGATEASRQTINLWVEQRTENKIRELLTPGILDSDSRLVLTNAIYFKGDWERAFKKEDTKEEDFHLSATQAIKTPLMHMTNGFSCLDGGSFQALEIPYKNKELSMIILLPKAMEGLSEFEQSLSPANMQQLLHQLRPAEKIIVTMPKFKIEALLGTGPALIAMGMRKALDVNTADFTGMASRKTMQLDGNLSIDAVIHKAYVDVNEEGTEAAAATAVITHRKLGAYQMPPLIFRADHPFMFLIRDNRSGSILFIGRVINPSGMALSDGVTLSPPDGKTATRAVESLEQEVAKYKEAQQERMQGAENIVFSGDRSTADIIRSYPFLNGSLKGVIAVRIAESRGNGTGVDLPLPNIFGQSRVNLLFVYKLGPLVLDSNTCGPNGCGLDVYADDGTGYKKALDWKYLGSAIHVSRANGQVELFIEKSGEQSEFVLQGNSTTGRSFAMKMPPHPRDCCGPALTHPLSPTSPH